ncbi:MAG: DUF4156 domain-containing protein [Ahniella sp.]|nr:DUF4156 domain-containing protein [Ahniella sp.]
MKRMLSIVLLTTLSACTWVKMDEGAGQIRVAEGSDLSACENKGTVTASVRSKVGFYERKDMKVEEELETMARNSAVEAGADTIQALSEIADGEQKFGMYRCR